MGWGSSGGEGEFFWWLWVFVDACQGGAEAVNENSRGWRVPCRKPVKHPFAPGGARNVCT